MRGIFLVVISLFTILLYTGCGEKEQPQVQNQNQMNDAGTSNQVHVVQVEEKMDASSYSYLKVNENGNSYWIAVPTMDVKPGEKIYFSKSMEMKDFKSETLGKTFESVLFVDDASKDAMGQDVASPHSKISTGKDVSIKVEPLKDGYSIEQIYC